MNNSILMDDLSEMLEVLGLGAHARPKSPHEAFQECIAEVRRLKGKEPKDIADRIEIALVTMQDASSLLKRHYLSIPAGQETSAADEAQMALCHLDWISGLSGVHPHRIAVIRGALNRLTRR